MLYKKLLYCYIVILLFSFFVFSFDVEIVNAKSCLDLRTETKLPYTCEFRTKVPSECDDGKQTCIAAPTTTDYTDCTGGTECCVCNKWLTGGGKIKPIVPYTGTEKYNKGDYQLNDFIEIAVNISQLILGITGSLALLMFVYGGIMFLISAGNTERVAQAQKIIVSAVVGIIIVFASWMIINLIMTSLGYSGTWYKISPSSSTQGPGSWLPIY